VVKIRLARSSDEAELVRMRSALWSDAAADELGQLDASTLPQTTFVAEGDGSLAGFVDVGLRSHADGCDSSHAVGFIEGWYVKESVRAQGIGRQLIVAAEKWARKQGCREMASDTWIANEPSQRAHEALGYEVVDRCVHYRKPL
jgi:aminoglycoside 6'-N-acetyltransferase I